MLPIVIYGAGKTMRQYLYALEKVYDIQAICDSDEKKRGMNIRGKQCSYAVMSPKQIEKYKDYDIFIASVYWEEIERFLLDRGFRHIHAIGADRPLAGDFEYSRWLYKQIVKGSEDGTASQGINNIYSSWSNFYKCYDTVAWLSSHDLVPFGGEYWIMAVE